MHADGSAVITILDGLPGRLDAVTCTLQLLYEVHDPSRYATPDLIIDFTGIRFKQLGPNRVLMTGARSLGPPPTLKVSGFLELPGFIADCEIGFAGTGALQRARCADADTAQIIEDEIYAMTLCGPAGGCSVRSERRPRIEVLDGYIARGLVQAEIIWSTA